MEFNDIVYALLAGIIPALLWLFFWLKEDNLHPEPRLLIALSFIGGGIMVIFAIYLENAVRGIIFDQTYRYIAWAFIEEILKFFAITLIALRSRQFDEPIDAMIYCITVALGFAAIENASFFHTSLQNGGLARSIISGDFRFLGSTLVHVVSTASIGFMIGLSFYKGVFLKVVSVILGIILAVALHAAFNLAIISATVAGTLQIFGWVWCGVVILIILFEEVKNIKPKTS